MTKPTLCLDFDGVIHLYRKGWQNGEIYDEMTMGFIDWSLEAAKMFHLTVYSSRSSAPEGIEAMRRWMWARAEEFYVDAGAADRWVALFTFADKKPAAFLTLDDRAITFHGDWRDPHLAPKLLRTFQPWNVERTS